MDVIEIHKPAYHYYKSSIDKNVFVKPTTYRRRGKNTMASNKTFRVMISKPEYLEILIARNCNVDDFGDITYTTAVSLDKAFSNIRYRISRSKDPDRRIISIEEVSK